MKKQNKERISEAKKNKIEKFIAKRNMRKLMIGGMEDERKEEEIKRKKERKKKRRREKRERKKER